MWWLKLYILICVTWIDIVNWDVDMIWIDELDMNIDYCGCDVNCHWEMINFGSDYDELLTIDWFVNVVENDVKVNCVCVENYVIEKDVEKWDVVKWNVEMLMMEEWIELLRLWIWELLNWDWFDEICEFDWVYEIYELHVFDGNELVVLNGWLICGKPRKKEMRLKAYAIWWDEKLGNVKLHQMNDMRKKNEWYWKRCPERENDWYEKKMPKWEKNVMRKMKMVYLILIFLFRQLNELSILIDIVWIDVTIGEYIWDSGICWVLINEYDMKCLLIDIAVLCDAWLILTFICLLSRQLTPWHFFPGFEKFWR